MVVQGQRRISAPLVEKLISFFSFSPDDELYFRRLVAINAKESTSIQHIEVKEVIERRTESSNAAAELITEQAWLSLVVKESAVGFSGRASAESIAASICTKPDVARVDELLSALVAIGYLKKTENAEGTAGFIYTPQSDPPPLPWTAETAHQFRRDGARACDLQSETLPIEDRVFQTSFVRIRKERLSEARVQLRAYQREFTRDFEEETGDEIVQFNLHLFPVSTGLRN